MSFFSALPAPWRSIIETALWAIPLVIIVAWVGGYIYRGYRNRADKAEAGREAARAAVVTEFELPPAPNSKQFESDGARARAALWRAGFHDEAIRLKNLYFEFIGRCGTLIACVFILAALEVTLLRDVTWLHRYFAAIDVFAALYILFYWWRSIRVNQQWVLARILSELLRQWLQLAFVFGLREEDMDQAFAAASDNIRTEVLQPRSRIHQWLGFGTTSEEFEKRIDGYWRALASRLQTNAAQISETAPRSEIYLHNRPVRQLDWYRMRQVQFSRAGRVRSLVMFSLFCFTLGVAALNFTFANVVPADDAQLQQIWQDVLNLSLLVATAASAALTYWYVSRNERSISHRYVSQRREIEHWLANAALLIKAKGALETAEILAFEEIMIGELVDWVHVTSHDVVELGA